MRVVIWILTSAVAIACRPPANIAIPEAQVKSSGKASAEVAEQDSRDLGDDDLEATPADQSEKDKPIDVSAPIAPETPMDKPVVVEKPSDIKVPVDPEEPEAPSVPKYYLYCFKDKVEGAKATVYCAVHETLTKKYFKVSNSYVKANWSYVAPSTATVTTLMLSSKHRYNVMFTVTAINADAINATLSGVTFKLDATDVNDKVDKFEKKGVDARIEMFVQSLKPQQNAGYRCFDRTRMNTKQIVTTPCNSNNISHDWYVNADSKIAHVTGECLMFDSYDGLAIVGDCDSGNTLKFDFNGEQIKIRGSNSCLGLKNQDLSGVDYAASVSCNSSDNQQKWKISPGAMR